MKLRYKVAEFTVRQINKLYRLPTANYQYVDNINYYSKEYLLTFDQEKPLKQIWEGWIDVTGANAQEVIDDLNKAVQLERTRKEQAKLTQRGEKTE